MSAHEKFNSRALDGMIVRAKELGLGFCCEEDLDVLGTPEDEAKAVSALASDKFMYATGNCIDIDGGFHMRSL